MLKQELQDKNMDEGAFRDDANYELLPTCQVLHVLLVFLQSFLLS